MHVSTASIVSSVLVLFSRTTAGAIDAGFDVYSTAQIMLDKSSQSWEWGTAAQALLELYNEDVSVFGSNPFPNGKVPSVDPGISALAYAKGFINRDSPVLVFDSAAGDPASLGVFAILLGQTDSVYLGASQRQADYILDEVPRHSNGAISHRPNIAELWADNVAMTFPFLAYLAVERNDVALMAEAVRQCGLYREVLKASGTLNWRHIIGRESEDPGLWSTGNGWAAYGMVRVLHTLQKWSGSSSLTSQAGELKAWIKEILDGAMISGVDNGLLRNYLNDDSWFGDISGTALLSAVAYRMAINDASMFPQRYIDWAEKNRKSLLQHQKNGLFSPAVNPYKWDDRKKFESGSPEGQAFMVNLYTGYRACVVSGKCESTVPPATTISHPGIGPIGTITVLERALTLRDPPPLQTGCGPVRSCDLDGCNGQFNGLVKHPQCTAGSRKGCQCIVTDKVCGLRQSCDLNGCDGKFNGLAKFPQCTGNFEGCECTVTPNVCGPRQSCNLNGCDGQYNGLAKHPQCTGNFEGCECSVTPSICGVRQYCDLNGCDGKFDGIKKYAQCTGNFEGCECSATEETCGLRQNCDLNGCSGGFNGVARYPQCQGNFEGCACQSTQTTCGARQSCDLNGCEGIFDGLNPYPQCSGNFVGCPCQATPNTCGRPQHCDLNGCDGEFNLADGKAYCTGNFRGCECSATEATCGDRQSCDLNNCEGRFQGLSTYPQCSNFFKGCACNATPNTCAEPQSCDLNGCRGDYSLVDGKAYCRSNFVGCECRGTSGTCGTPQSCEQNNCQGAFSGLATTPTCTNFFEGCVCRATSKTCGPRQNCDLNGCSGGYDTNGVARCQGNFVGCECNATPNTCGVIQNCDLNGCNGAFNGGQTATCQGNFRGCACRPVASTCGTRQSCALNGCKGGFNDQGYAVCMGNFYGCPCEPDPIWIPSPTLIPLPTTTQPPPPPQTHAPPPRPTRCPDDWIGVGFAQLCGSRTGCGGNFGAILVNGCRKYYVGDDNSFCNGGWQKSRAVECNSSGEPVKVTAPEGVFGHCFRLERDCSEAWGGTTWIEKYHEYCCSPL